MLFYWFFDLDSNLRTKQNEQQPPWLHILMELNIFDLQQAPVYYFISNDAHATNSAKQSIFTALKVYES